MISVKNMISKDVWHAYFEKESLAKMGSAFVLHIKPIVLEPNIMHSKI